jgi:hypothetical protein
MAYAEMAEARSTRRKPKAEPMHHMDHPHGELHHLEMHHADNGGHLVVHHFHPMSYGMDGGHHMEAMHNGSFPYAMASSGEGGREGAFKPPKMPEHHAFGPSEGPEMLAHVANHMEVEPGEPKSQAEEEVGEEEV